MVLGPYGPRVRSKGKQRWMGKLHVSILLELRLKHELTLAELHERIFKTDASLSERRMGRLVTAAAHLSMRGLIDEVRGKYRLTESGYAFVKRELL
jgi:hypothetical protein